MVYRVRSRPALIYRGTPNGGSGSTANFYFTNDAKTDAYYVDDAKVNKYKTNGGMIQQPNLTLWRASLAAQTAGTKSPRLLCIGDSTTFGSYSETVGNERKTNAYPNVLRGLFVSGGRLAQANSDLGQGSQTFDRNLINDLRLTVGAGWVAGTTATGTTGGTFFQNPTTTNPLIFTPTESIDTFKIWYVSTPTSGTLSYAVDGGGYTGLATAAANGLRGPVTIPAGALGAHTLSIARLSGNPIYLVAIEAYDSSQKQISVMNGGWAGASTVDAASTTNAWSPNNTLDYYQQDLTLLMWGINDWVNGTALPTFKTNMQAIITKAKLSGGDVVLMSPVPSQTTTTAQSVQQGYVDILADLAITNSILFIDLWRYFGDWNTANTNGWMANDLHPNQLGYSVMAQYIYNKIAQ